MVQQEQGHDALTLIEEEEEERRTRSDGAPAQASCDFCGETKALLYCRADAARLCLACDRTVHAANSVSSRHHRSLLCDACRAAPSAILCSSSCRSLLCSNCDFDAHGQGGLVQLQHERRPVETFSGCPVAVELVSVLGVGEDEKALVAGAEGDGVSEYLVEDGWMWETPSVFSLDDLIVPTTACHGFQATVMPPLPKHRNLSCGKHKEEILRQIRELIKIEKHDNYDGRVIEPVVEFHSQIQEQTLQLDILGPSVHSDVTWMFAPFHEVTMLEQPQSDFKELTNTFSLVAPYEDNIGSSSAVSPLFLHETAEAHSSATVASLRDRDAENSVNGEKMQHLPPTCGHELACTDRSSVISRYKEKKKTRRYDKHILYESRKIRADTRLRIKGRFAKVNQVSEH